MEFVDKIVAGFKSTNIHKQIIDVDIVGLSSNKWFIIPFGLFIGYMAYKKQWRDLIIIAICIGVWWVSGTPYMDSLLVDGEIDIEKILPVIFGGIIALGLIIYLLFGQSD